MVIPGVVLAAGRSTRMGAPKALLERDGTTFLAAAVRAMREGGCSPVFAVAPLEPAEVARHAETTGAITLINPVQGSEQIDSIRIALDALPAGAPGVLLSPVDVPFIGETVRRLVASFESLGSAIHIPVARGVRGHPVIFRADLFEALRAPDLEEGARTVIDRHRADVAEVEVDDMDAARDIDTPEDYRRFTEERVGSG